MVKFDIEAQFNQTKRNLKKTSTKFVHSCVSLVVSCWFQTQTKRTQIWKSHMLPKSYAPKVICSQSHMLLKSHASEVTCSQSHTLLKAHALRDTYSGSHILPKSLAPIVTCSQSHMLSKWQAPKVIKWLFCDQMTAQSCFIITYYLL